MYRRIRLCGLLRTVARSTPAVLIPIFESRDQFDKNLTGMEQEGPTKGIDAVKQMFRRNHMDEVSVELHNIVQAAVSGALIGACYGGFIESRQAYLYFIENNQATIFKTTLQAKKKLQDYVFVAFARGAYHYGWRIAFFVGCFSLISTIISVYRGDTSILEYAVAGTVTGGLYKANLGLAATVVGAGLGGALSAVAGVVIVILLKITGIQMEDIRKAFYSIKINRESQMDQAREQAAEIKNDDLTKYHEQHAEQSGLKKLQDL